MRKLREFLKSTAGNMAITGAIAMVPIIGCIAAALDISAYAKQKSNVQNALDAAALAAAKELQTNSDMAYLEDYAKDFFEANLDDAISMSDIVFTFDVTMGDPTTTPPTPTTVDVGAELTYNTVFDPVVGVMDVLGVDEIIADVTSQISVGSRSVEIALVMDNSGSMSTNNRLSIMQTETKALIDTIYEAGELSDINAPVKFSVVPFGGMVNIGTNNKNKNWMDKKGWASYHHQNFDWNTYETTKNTRFKHTGFQVAKDTGGWDWFSRIDVYDMMGVEWGGCVEMRPWPYNVTDEFALTNQGFNALKNSIDIDGDGVGDANDALFVYNFAPDTPRQYSGEQYYYNNYLEDYKYSDGWFNSGSAPDTTDFAGHNHGSYTFDHTPAGSDSIDRMRWMFKYQENDTIGSIYEWHGPNKACTTNPIIPLTETKQDIVDAIDDMQADGITNLQQGLTWGWRTLSDNEPFTEGRSNDDDKNMKYVIFLTDGNNFYSKDYGDGPLRTDYGAWGFAIDDDDPGIVGDEWKAQNRWIEGLTASDLAGTIYAGNTFDTTPESYNDFEEIMNAHTLQACNNMKNDAITIFTIAFDVADGSSVKDLLEACAGAGMWEGDYVVENENAQFYFDVASGDLDDAMTAIASQIGDLRIVK